MIVGRLMILSDNYPSHKYCTMSGKNTPMPEAQMFGEKKQVKHSEQ